MNKEECPEDNERDDCKVRGKFPLFISFFTLCSPICNELSSDWCTCPWEFFVMLSVSSICYLSMSHNEAGIQKGKNIQLYWGALEVCNKQQFGAVITL